AELEELPGIEVPIAEADPEVEPALLVQRPRAPGGAHDLASREAVALADRDAGQEGVRGPESGQGSAGPAAVVGDDDVERARHRPGERDDPVCRGADGGAERGGEVDPPMARPIGERGRAEGLCDLALDRWEPPPAAAGRRAGEPGPPRDEERGRRETQK